MTHGSQDEDLTIRNATGADLVQQRSQSGCSQATMVRSDSVVSPQHQRQEVFVPWGVFCGNQIRVAGEAGDRSFGASGSL